MTSARTSSFCAATGNLTLVGVPPAPAVRAGVRPHPPTAAQLSGGSPIGGVAQTQEMLDFCGAHDITADVEVIQPFQKVNEAYERLLRLER